MAEKIDQKTGDICPHGEENRCEFLNEDNLCDIVAELGEDYLCETCYTHPRHEEVYPDVRERSLAITCPIACRQLLERKEPVRIIYEDTDEPGDKDKKFDYELFDVLLKTRDNLLKLQQDRELTISQRMALSLGISHDIERRIRAKSLRNKNTGFLDKLFAKKNSFTDEELGDIEKILKYYKKSDVMIMASECEAFGRTTVEAMQSGCLVIGSDSGATPDILNHGKAGILFKPRDSVDLKNKMIYVMKNKSICRKIAKDGQNRAIRKYTARENAKQIYEVYKSILHE